MSLANFVPELWSDRLFVNLRKALVYGSLCQRDYEGEIRNFGDTVKINEIGAVNVTAYTNAATLTYQTLSSAQKELKIDQASYFAFSIDDIDAAQVKPKLMDAAMNDAAYRIADTIDQFIAGLYAQAGATPSATTYIGSATTHLHVSSGNVIETISYASRYLSDKNVPTGGRFMVIPPWVTQKIALAASGSISAIGVPKVMSDGALVNGWVGKLMGFDLFESPNVYYSATPGYAVMCGTRDAISYAGQVSKVGVLERETTFDTAARGLYVYGAKVTRPDALLTLYLDESAG
jgi:hypothetical protein